MSTIVALTAVVTGAYLPWIRPNPTLAGETDRIPDILLPEMNAGIEGYSVLLLLAVLAVAILLVRGLGTRRRSLVVVLVGLFSAVVPLYYLIATSLAGFDSTFVPAAGWYLTVGGGVLLVVSGLGQLTSSSTSNGATSESTF